jgi:TolB-like protein
MRGFIRELRRRRVFRTAAVYIVGAWLVMQAADVFFPGWGLSDSAINVLLVAAILGFPLALVFGWFFDITGHGIVRTPAADEEAGDAPLPLQRSDYLVLFALVLIAAAIAYDATVEIATTRSDPTYEAMDELPVAREKLPQSVAVLPFANISNDPENDAFCDGVSEELINRLSAFGDLHVIARTSSFAFKGSDYLVPRISDILGVRYLLQGSVRKIGDQIRISAQLVDASGAQQWSDTFDRTLEQVFEVQSEIAELVATTVVPRIVPPVRPSRDPDPVAYQHFLIGREHVYQRDVREAREQLARAIELDPEFAEARAEYAVAILLFPLEAGDQARAEKVIDSALALAPDLPRALAARALLARSRVPPDNDEAIRLLERALAGEPNMVDAMNWLAGSLTSAGRKAEAFAILQRAWKIDPLHVSIVANLALRHGEQGEFARQEQLLRYLIAVPNPAPIAFTHLATYYKSRGQLVELNAVAKDRVLRSRRGSFILAMSYLLLGMDGQADYWMGKAQADKEQRPFNSYFPALLARLRGDHALSVDLFAGAMARQGQSLEDANRLIRLWWGLLQSLAGDHLGAIAALEPFAPVARDMAFGDPVDSDAIYALVWSLQQAGRPEEAQDILTAIEQAIAEYESEVEFPDSERVFFNSLAALLGGDRDLAIARLERAVDIGWSDYYLWRQDPRLALLADEPRFRQVMAAVRARVNEQRAEVERIDAEDDFRAQAEARISAR